MSTHIAPTEHKIPGPRRPLGRSFGGRGIRCVCDYARDRCRRSARRPATTDIRRCGRRASPQGRGRPLTGTLSFISGDSRRGKAERRESCTLTGQVRCPWQCRTSVSPKISLLVRTCVLPRPLEICRITTVVPQRDRSTASFGSHRHGNGLRSNREIAARA